MVLLASGAKGLLPGLASCGVIERYTTKGRGASSALEQHLQTLKRKTKVWEIKQRNSGHSAGSVAEASKIDHLLLQFMTQ